jgi:hypothetical protein
MGGREIRVLVVIDSGSKGEIVKIVTGKVFRIQVIMGLLHIADEFFILRKELVDFLYFLFQEPDFLLGTHLGYAKFAGSYLGEVDEVAHRKWFDISKEVDLSSSIFEVFLFYPMLQF